MPDKEKRKGNPRRRLFIVLMIIVCVLVAGFSIVPHVEERLLAWLDDDPFTPMCDAGHLELAFTQEVNGIQQINLIKADGSNWRQINSYPSQTISSMFWTQDDRFLDLQVRTEEIASEHHLVDPNSLEIVTKYTGENGAWSTDGQLAYLVTGAGSLTNQINIYNSQTNAHRPLIFEEHSRFSVSRWSLDNRYLIYTQSPTFPADESGSQFIVHDIENDKIVLNHNLVYSRLGGNRTVPMAWSPDGQKFYYWIVVEDRQLSGIWVLDFSGANVTFEQIIVDEKVSGFAISPDGTTLAYSHEQDAIVYNLDSKSEQWRYSDEELMLRIVYWDNWGVYIVGDEDPK